MPDRREHESNGLTAAFNQQLTAASKVSDALAHIVAHFAADSGTIHFIEADGLLHLAAVTRGMPDAVLATIKTIPVGKGMAGLAVERRAPVDACNIQTDTSGDVRPGARATALSGAIVVPIFSGEEVVGALGVANRSERSFAASEIADLIATARVLAARRVLTAEASEPGRPL
jgi:signal transduction protein with GAF and PtsI domain